MLQLQIFILVVLGTSVNFSAVARAGSLQLPPVANISSAQRTAFDSGFKEFKHFFSPREGLGPVYASNACIACHASGGRGPILIEKMALVKPQTVEPIADQEKYFPWGQSIRPFFAYPANQGTTKESGVFNPPSEDEATLLVTQRMPPMIFGRGAMEAISDSEIVRVESEQARRQDGIHGHVNWIGLKKDRIIGRFGLKARLPTLESFTADAYVSDMGITSEVRPIGTPNRDGVNDPAAPELPPGKVSDVAAFMRFMSSPQREAPIGEGAKIFNAIQCGVCHVPRLAVDANHPLAKLGLLKAEVYSDLLVHDMGQKFGDGLQEESAGSREWRTAPLVNLAASKSFLHDGRAGSVEAAIVAHGDADSEAFQSVQKFRSLSAENKKALIEFVERL